jgi:hypothetical protein
VSGKTADAPPVGADVEKKLPDGAVRVKLLRALQIPGKDGIETTDHLTFREPTAEDIEIAGCPVMVDSDFRGEPKVEFDERKMNAMFARLSGIPLPFIRKMRSADWANCSWAIAPFFILGAEK